jgi:conjugative transfer region protein TrbK
MNARNIVAAAVFVSLACPLAASAQSMDDLLKDQALLRSELNRCKQMGMASNDNAQCKTARTAEQKRFFSGGVGYTEKPVQVTPGEPVPPITNNPPPANRKPSE